jgi:predicted metal-binding membrane protein/arylsulfatase A-like enzyme
LVRRDRTVTALALLAVTAIAWAWLLRMQSGMAHDDMAMAMPDMRSWSAAELFALFLMWAVMMAAMMLPSAAPMILLFAGVQRRRLERAGPAVPTAVFAAGYLLVWTVFSAAAALTQWGLHQAALLSPAMASTSPILGGTLLVIAGAYQWLPFKSACLGHCRSPLGFFGSEWREGSGGALAMGVRHGTYCLGCCWALMTLLFVVGVMHVPWVAAIAALVLVEKVTRVGPWIGRLAGIGLILWGGWMLAGGLPSAAAQSPPDSPPNVIVFVGDDLGWRDTGPYGNEAIRTPNIDRLARSGLEVQRAFGTSPQCSPSRISILTGKYPHATGTEDLHMPLPEDERILPSYLGERGWFTGHMAKTHYGPAAERQFRWYSPETAAAFPAFLDAAGEGPFFLWVGFHEPHRPYGPGAVPDPHAPESVKVPPHLADTPETRADLALYYDAIARSDRAIGHMVAELERRKLRDNTLIVFLSDNGAPFPREKGTLYDSGIRTPLILSWPKVIRPGTVYDRGLVSTVDLTPTLLDIAGVALPDAMQGRSFRALLTAPTSYVARTHVFSERNWHDCDEHQRAVRTGHFKLIRTDAYTELPLCTAADIGASPSFLALRALARAGRLTAAQRPLFQAPRPRLELYDFESDPWELRNVADDPAHAKVVRELAAVLQDWMEESGDFPASYRLRDDNTDRVTGVQFSTRIPPMRDTVVPEGERRWGIAGPK